MAEEEDRELRRLLLILAEGRGHATAASSSADTVRELALAHGASILRAASTTRRTSCGFPNSPRAAASQLTARAAASATLLELRLPQLAARGRFPRPERTAMQGSGRTKRTASAPASDQAFGVESPMSRIRRGGTARTRPSRDRRGQGTPLVAFSPSDAAGARARPPDSRSEDGDAPLPPSSRGFTPRVSAPRRDG